MNETVEINLLKFGVLICALLAVAISFYFKDSIGVTMAQILSIVLTLIFGTVYIVGVSFWVKRKRRKI